MSAWRRATNNESFSLVDQEERSPCEDMLEAVAPQTSDHDNDAHVEEESGDSPSSRPDQVKPPTVQPHVPASPLDSSSDTMEMQFYVARPHEHILDVELTPDLVIRQAQAETGVARAMMGAEKQLHRHTKIKMKRRLLRMETRALKAEIRASKEGIRANKAEIEIHRRNTPRALAVNFAVNMMVGYVGRKLVRFAGRKITTGVGALLSG